MKKQTVKTLSVLLALVLIVGLLPGISLPAAAVEKINYASVHVQYPVAGEHPTIKALPVNYNETAFTVDSCKYYPKNGSSVGSALTSTGTFKANQDYLVKVHLTAKNGYAFHSGSEGLINYRNASVESWTATELLISIVLKGASGTCTVTFDANGHGTAPDPIQVPKGGTIWDAIRNYQDVWMADRPYERFDDWDTDPFAVDSFFPFGTEITAPMTLYAVWEHCVSSVVLYVTMPYNMLTDGPGVPTVTVPKGAAYTAIPDDFWDSASRIGDSDMVYGVPLTPGKTYYSQIHVNTKLAGDFPSVQLFGGKKIGVVRENDNWFAVQYSVTIPANTDAVTSAAFYLNTPRAGESANDVPPSAMGLTPGVNIGADAWYETDNVGYGEPFTGTFVAGKTYYTLVTLASPFSLSYNKLSLTPKGKNVKVQQLLDLASWYSIPNYVGAVVSVTIPKGYMFVVGTPGGGGKIRGDRWGENWVSLMDFGNVEEGTVTLEARPDGDHLFKMWYSADDYSILSKKSTYSFNVDHNVNIRASFVKRPPFVDVGAWDYFYEPVMWAIEQEPQITKGTDDTHFSPKEKCTRAQVVTFIWNALGRPEPASLSNPFQDVKSSKYYYKAVLWAYHAGVTKGADAAHFDPDGSCTRAQVVSFLWNAEGKPSPGMSSCPFKDVKPGKYYYNAVLWAFKEGITKGIDATHFGPDSVCTRAQVVTFLCNAYGPKG